MKAKPGKWILGVGIILILTFLLISGVNASNLAGITDNGKGEGVTLPSIPVPDTRSTLTSYNEEKVNKTPGTPGTAENWIEKGLLLIVPGSYDQAIDAFDQAIKINPDNIDAWYQKGMALEGLEKYEEAIQAFDQVTRIDTSYVDAWNNKGDDWSTLGKYQEAIDAYDQAIRIDPNYDWSWFNKAENLFSLGRYQEAIQAFDQAIQIDPVNAGPWSGKGDALSKLGRYEDAVKAYNMALKISPDDTDIQKNRDIASGKQGEEGNLTGVISDEDVNNISPLVQIQSASETGEKSFISPEPFTYTPRMFFIVGITPDEKKRLDSQLETLETQLKTNSESKELRAEKGNLLRLYGRFSDAAAEYKGILKDSPDYAPALTGIATVITEAYNPELNGTLPGYVPSDAITAYEQSLKLDPDNPVTLTGLGYAYRLLAALNPENNEENIKNALDTFNKAIDIESGSVDAIIGRAMTQDNDQDSISDLKQALSINPDSAEANILLGLISAEPSYINTTISLQPDQTYPYIFQGLVQENNNDFPGAIESLQTALKKYDLLSPFPGKYLEIYNLLATISLESSDINSTLKYEQDAENRFSEGGDIS